MRPRILIAALFLLAAVCATGAAGLDRAEANSPILDFQTSLSTTQAGGHPDIVTRLEVGTPETAGDEGKEYPSTCLCEAVKNTTVELPAGVFANPHSTPTCTLADFVSTACPVDSQVGVVVTHIGNFASLDGPGFVAALYNMTPRPEQAGLLAFTVPFGQSPIFINVTTRTESDYGLELETVGIPRIVAINGTTIVNWGVPADKSHDALRFPFGCCGPAHVSSTYCEKGDPRPYVVKGVLPTGACDRETELTGASSNSPEEPYTSLPTSCGTELTASLETDAYDLGTDFAETDFPTITGCSLLDFNPSQSLAPTTTEADSPSGAEFVVTAPQFQSPTVPSPSQLKEVEATLPEGFTIAPSLANGKVACTDEQARIGTRLAAQCPEEAKIGTLVVDSSGLPGSMFGAVYIAEPRPGNRYRMFLVFDGFGLHIKLPGSIRVDSTTGRVRLQLANLPQVPISKMAIHMFGSERGSFVTPDHCGTYEIETVFTPHAQGLPKQTSRQFFTIDSGPDGTPCPGAVAPFEPTFNAGSADNTGGVFSPLSIDVTRSDGQQNLTSLTVTTPPGLSASLRGTRYCPEQTIAALRDSGYSGLAELTAPACTAASQVGSVKIAVGQGTDPLYQDGKVFLAGPYKGAPLSLLIVTPLVSGPYDLGNIAVRSTLQVNPVTGQVTTVTDPLPQIVDGFPLRIRHLRLDLDRDRFTINPTDCSRFTVDATMVGTQGAVAQRRSRFQAANCADLSFSPSLELRLSGGVRRRGHPAIHATFRTKPGEANTRFASVLLPEGQLLDNKHIGTVCTRVAFAARNCPEGSRLGSAEVVTPLLDEPLRGFAYLRSSSNDLPDIAVDLRGQVDFELVGAVDSVNARLRTTFTAPDLPVSRFSLDLAGGKRGLLQNTENLCEKKLKATVRMIGQNERRATRAIPLRPSCGKKGGK